MSAREVLAVLVCLSGSTDQALQVISDARRTGQGRYRKTVVALRLDDTFVLEGA